MYKPKASIDRAYRKWDELLSAHKSRRMLLFFKRGASQKRLWSQLRRNECKNRATNKQSCYNSQKAVTNNKTRNQKIWDFQNISLFSPIRACENCNGNIQPRISILQFWESSESRNVQSLPLVIYLWNGSLLSCWGCLNYHAYLSSHLNIFSPSNPKRIVGVGLYFMLEAVTCSLNLALALLLQI